MLRIREMSFNMDGADLKKQRERHRRVSRMRKGLVSIVFLALVFLLIACIVLGVMVFRLNSKVNQLDLQLQTIAGTDIDATTVTDEENLSDGSISSDAGTSEASSDSEATYSGPEYGVDEHQSVYLTFDDGPSDNTEAILDILDEYNVKATFFVVGTENEEYQALYREIVERGHTLGMHSYTHRYSTLYESLESFEDEITTEIELLESVTGVKPWLFRFPGGSSNSVCNADMSDLISYLNDIGITYFDWNVVGADATSQAYTTQDVIDSVAEDIGKYQTAVILLHDANTKSTTVDALDDLIEFLQERDCDILPITEDTPLVQHVRYDSVE